MQSQQQEAERPIRRYRISWMRIIILLIILILVAATIFWLINGGGTSEIFGAIFTSLGAIFGLVALILSLSASPSTASSSPTSSLETTTGDNQLEDKKPSQNQPTIETSSKLKSRGSIAQNNNRQSISIAREQGNQFNIDRQQTYITLVVALQILAFGVLLFAFTETASLTNIRQSYYYLPHFASFLILLTILSTINLRISRLSVLQISLLHFLTIFEIIAFRFFNNLLYWLFCIGFLFILEGIFQFVNSFYQIKDRSILKFSIFFIIRNSLSLKIIAYPTFGIIFLIFDLIYNYYENTYYNPYPYSNTPNYTLIFFILSTIAILILLFLENTSFHLFKRQKQKEVDAHQSASDNKMSNSSIIRFRIVEEPLTAFNVTTILTALTELNTKCWLIQQNRLAELIEYTQTHDTRFIEEANLVITKLSRNSPADFELQTGATPDPQARARALTEALTRQFTPIQEQIARLDNHAREIGQQIEEIKTHPILSNRVQSQRSEEKKTELEELEKRLEDERRQRKLELELLEVEKQRLMIQEMRLDYEKKRVDYALDTAAKMINILCPNANQEAREVQLRTLLPNLLQLGNGKGVEFPMPPREQEDSSIESDKPIEEG